MRENDTLLTSCELLYSYSRAQAIADGVLVDVTQAARKTGFTVPVAVTSSVWADCVQWDAEIKARKAISQDKQGRLWCLLLMAYTACQRAVSEQRLIFENHRVPSAGRTNAVGKVALALHIGPGDNAEPVITIMQPDED